MLTLKKIIKPIISRAILFKKIVKNIFDTFIFSAKFILYGLLIVLVLVVLFSGYIGIKTNPKKARPLYIILLGSPESSKETIGMVLSKKYKIPYLSVQDILNQSNNSKYSSISKDRLIKKTIAERLVNKNSKNGLILNGYPYNLNQADNLHSFIMKIVQKCAFVIIISAVKINSDNTIIPRRSKTGLILDYRWGDSILDDPIATSFISYRGAIFIDLSKLTPKEYNTLFKAIDDELSGYLFK